MAYPVLVVETCREAGELTPNPEHTRVFPVHLLAEALLMSSNLIFKPDLIHALFSMPDEVLGCE